MAAPYGTISPEMAQVMRQAAAEMHRQSVKSSVEDIMQRPGMFSIAEDSLRLRPDVALKTMSQVVITGCYYESFKNSFVYEGYSMAFKKMEPGENPLTYLVVYDWEEDEITFQLVHEDEPV